MHVYIAGGYADARMCATCVLSENPHFVGWNYSPCLICRKMVSLMSPDYFSSDPRGGGLMCGGRRGAHAPRWLLDNCIDYRALGQCVPIQRFFFYPLCARSAWRKTEGDTFRLSGRRLWSNILNVFPNNAKQTFFFLFCFFNILTPGDTPYFTP